MIGRSDRERGIRLKAVEERKTSDGKRHERETIGTRRHIVGTIMLYWNHDMSWKLTRCYSEGSRFWLLVLFFLHDGDQNCHYSCRHCFAVATRATTEEVEIFGAKNVF